MKSFATATEAQIEFACLDYLVRVKRYFFWKQPTAGYYSVKQKVFRKQASPFAINGVADILGCIKGRLIALEVKKKGNYQTPTQKLFEESLKASGGFYYVIHDLIELEDALKEIESKL